MDLSLRETMAWEASIEKYKYRLHSFFIMIKKEILGRDRIIYFSVPAVFGTYRRDDFPTSHAYLKAFKTRLRKRLAESRADEEHAQTE